MFLLVSLLAAWLAADFGAGIVHWFEDQYLDDMQSFEFLQGAASDNTLHHDKPTAMLLNSQWENMRSSAVVMWPCAAIAAALGAPLWVVAMFFFAAFGNLVHRFAHTPASQLPTWIVVMQRSGLFISHRHHDTHHRYMGRLVPKGQASRAYCPMTDWVNPVLDAIRFWNGLEFAFARAGLQPTSQRTNHE